MNETSVPVAVTANELHVPVGKSVFLNLESVDVVHSFWLPRLAGKTDVVPGRTNKTWFRAERPGLYLGQCAEYCGTQHAHMLLRVIAEPQEDFDRWLANEQKPAVDEPAARTGRDTFLSHGCVNCHTITGTIAKGTFGPDLTHLMSRQTLASGMVPNDKETLTKWVNDPQTIKPGCLMPSFNLSEQKVRDIVTYLLTLK